MNIPIIVLVSIAIVVCVGFWYVWWNQHKLVNDLQQIKLNLQVLQTKPPEEKKNPQQLNSISPSDNPIHQNQVEQHHVSENEIYQSENNKESSSESDDSSDEDSYSDDDDDLSSQNDVQNEVETSEYLSNSNEIKNDEEQIHQESENTYKDLENNEDINKKESDLLTNLNDKIDNNNDIINKEVTDYINDTSIKMAEDISKSTKFVNESIDSNSNTDQVELNATVVTDTENFVENQGEPEKMRISLKQKTVSELKKLCEKNSLNIKKPGGYKNKKELIECIVEKYSE